MKISTDKFFKIIIIQGTNYILWNYYFFEQVKMEYNITQRMVHLAQGVQKRTTHQNNTVKIMMPYNSTTEERQ